MKKKETLFFTHDEFFSYSIYRVSFFFFLFPDLPLKDKFISSHVVWPYHLQFEGWKARIIIARSYLWKDFAVLFCRACMAISSLLLFFLIKSLFLFFVLFLQLSYLLSFVLASYERLEIFLRFFAISSKYRHHKPPGFSMSFYFPITICLWSSFIFHYLTRRFHLFSLSTVCFLWVLPETRIKETG